jgi:hypothetical protein
MKRIDWVQGRMVTGPIGVISVAICACLLTCFVVISVDHATPPARAVGWYSVQDREPEIDKPFIGVYLMGGEIVPIRSKMSIFLNAKGIAEKWYYYDSDRPINNLGAPSLWQPLPFVPDKLLESTRKP